jgi:predicted RNase H-related nuclease YkuK (DUF458 family)
MERNTFKTLSNHKTINLIDYIANYVIDYPETEILIGCDSQNHKRNTLFAIVIGLYRPGKGAHVLYSRFEQKREKDSVTRLLNEVWFSVEVAEKILNELGIRASNIDIDINPDPKYKSNVALSSAVGIVQGLGYTCRHKGNYPTMTYCADSLVK